MAIDDWCDVAWAYILRTTPMMANPHEYRETLWTILHDGEAPKPAPETDRKSRSHRPRQGMTKRDKVELAGFMDQIAQLKAAHEVKDPPTPRA